MLEKENIWNPESWRKFQRGVQGRARARAAGVNVRELDILIRELVEHITPDLRRLFKVDLPAKINEAIADIKRQGARGLFKTAKTGQGCGGPKSFGYDWEGKTRRFCSHE